MAFHAAPAQNFAMYGLAPHGYYDSHEPWEHHEAIVAYHNLGDSNKLPEHYSAMDRQVVAQAYVLHDQHFNKTFEQLIASYVVLPQAKYKSYAESIGKYITRALEGNPELVDAVANGNVSLDEVAHGFQFQPYWTGTETIYNELQEQVTRGNITDLYTYYNYMTTHHLNEVLGQGW